MFTKKFGPPPLANDYSYADRTTTMIMPLASRVKAETINVGHVPREMSRTFWNFIVHGGSVGCEITGRRTRSDAR